MFLLAVSYYKAQGNIKSLNKSSDKAQEVFNSLDSKPKVPPVNFVNTFIGTGGHGHTFPGAVAPFGMMQLSPDTRYEGWDGCSGYHYSDSIIYGFSHTHLSGTGVPDYCDLLIVPQCTSKPKTTPGYKSADGYGQTFSHSQEKASPGFYEVFLKEQQIKAELTVSERSGIHHYTFNDDKHKKYILIDLDHRDKLLDVGFKIHDKKHISGKRISNNWANEQHFYFDLEFSETPCKIKKIYKNDQHKLLLTFSKKTKELEIHVGISLVSENGAFSNRTKELSSFNKVKNETSAKWNKELSKIQIETTDTEKEKVFYTALYHCFIAPNLASDVDGRYRGHDQKIHQLEEGERHYTVFSLWDTYRTLHPLFTLIQPERTEEFIRTMLRMYDERNDLPVWELAACETECMIGYHSVSVIADAYMKGYNNFDITKALDAMVHTSKLDEWAKKEFANQGFISSDQEAESVSKTLEYAYDDFCIAQMANKMGESVIYEEYMGRSLNFVNLYDPSSKFMRARRGAQWFGPFDPSEVNFNYTEANSWQYSLYAPHNIPVLAGLMGGKDSLERWLDDLFTAKSDLIGRHQVDITGLIGQYAHGNEPSHHMAYLYNFTNKPEKTQLYVDRILNELYSIHPDGLSGNEDCGQMSAWYVMSAMGLYPIAPGTTFYQIGRPLFDRCSVWLGKNKTLHIEAANNSEDSKYVKSVLLNNQIISGTQIDHLSIKNGATIKFEMSTVPVSVDKTKTSEDTLMVSDRFIPTPFIINEIRVFEDSMSLELGFNSISQNKTYLLYYSIDRGPWNEYSAAFTIYSTSVVSIRLDQLSNTNQRSSSPIVQSLFTKRDQSVTLHLKTEYANQYSAAGPNTLVDGVRGGPEFRTGDWQGFYGKDVDAEIVFDDARPLKQIGVSCIRDLKSWIFFPTKILLSYSVDGIHFIDLPEIVHQGATTSDYDPTTFEFVGELENKTKVKAIRYRILNPGVCPSWHLGDGNDTWLFLDELLFN
jgi:predicted alpha-1,2-mannosidase